MSTKNRFPKFIKMEALVVERVRKLADMGGVISRVVPADGGALYDRLVILDSGQEIKLEIQITSPENWEKYKDLRLDLISAYRHKPDSRFIGKVGIAGTKAQEFLDSLTIERYGKLFSTDANVLAYYIPAPADLLWIFNMRALQQRAVYFYEKYGIRENVKSDDEDWESCFVPVPEDDIELVNCGVRHDGGEAAEAEETSNPSYAALDHVAVHFFHELSENSVTMYRSNPVKGRCDDLSQDDLEELRDDLVRIMADHFPSLAGIKSK